MTAKEYLMQIRQLNTDIQNLTDEIDSIKEEEATIRSAWPDGQPHGSGTTDPTGAKAIRLADKLSTLEDELKYRRNVLWKKRTDILATIEQMQRAEYKRLLYLRYVQCCTWEEIAVEMHYTYQWVAGPLHGNALQEFEKIINC